MKIDPIKVEGMEKHEDALLVFEAHERCMHWDIGDGTIIYCGAVNMHRPTQPTADGWFCAEHRNGRKVISSVGSLEEYFALSQASCD